MNDQDEERIDPGHNRLRQVGRVLGPVLILIGGIFMTVGLISFFSSMGTFEPPRLFWCCFVGGPLFVIGGAITKLAFLGSFLRYFVGEVAPVQKDAFNYIASGIRPGVKDLAQAVSEGITSGVNSALGEQKCCKNCGASASGQANFCAACGRQLE